MAELNFETDAMNWDALEKKLGDGVNQKKKNYNDERFWKLSRDDNDNGGAIIRLLPDPTGTPFLQRYKHAFKVFDNASKKVKWYINVSPETINEPCPASELWQGLWSLNTEESQKEARKFGRKISFITNIKVIKDPLNPQNEGKIFLWEFGPKLKDKFMAALEPTETEISMGEKPKELYNPFIGCNIKLKIKKAGGFLNYDDTEIQEVSSVYADSEAAKSDIINNGIELNEFKKMGSFETYVELKKKLKYVLDSYKAEFITQDDFNKVAQNALGTSLPTETQKETVKEVQKETVKEVQKEDLEDQSEKDFLADL